ncbi:QWRF motif-containing protein 3-like [Diospyros lotus]|uniref:QWRF motif-containing protein 3-like n=1 Tax=Diospyros lotus TaxID=55363 RepID=UPI002257B1E0|nr:QWRF motif-containing protein 3-like [Diospyros lotus]
MDAGTTPHSDQLSPVVKPLRPKSRQVTSRFLSPPADQSSPLKQKPRSIHSNESGGGGSMRRLWPSTSSSNKKKQQQKQQLGTLADHLGNERFNDLIVKDKVCSEFNNSESCLMSTSLSRQRSCTEFSRFEKVDDHRHESRRSTKENHRPLFGGSMRYTGKLRFPAAGRKSASSSSSSSSGASNSYLSPASADDIVAGRFSVDENALRQRSFGRGSEDLESECSDVCSGNSFGSPDIGKLSTASYMAPTVSSRKSGGGIQVSSRYMQDSSPKKFTLKNAINRSNSITTSKWALSPGRSASPPMTVENKGMKPVSFLSMKPPTSPSRPKGGGGGGVGNFLSKGLDLFRSKKSSPTSCSSPLGPAGMAESVHQLRVLHSRWVQWRYANARADYVNARTADQAERNLIYAWNCVKKLEQSVIRKKLQLEKEKLEMKLNFILLSQIKLLEAWGDMERQHLSAISMTKDCLHSVICRVPLAEDAKMDLHSTSITLRNASDLSTSIKSMLYTFSPTVEKAASIFSDLAKVVTEEKALLEELFELFSIISTLEIEERSLKCSITQLKLWQQTSTGTAR